MTLNRRTFLMGGAALGAASLAGFAQWEMSKQDTNARILIAGGGAAGISIANRLQHHLNGARITVVDARPYHWYQPGQTLLLAGAYKTLDDVVSDNSSYLSGDTRWIQDEIAEFQPDNNRALTKSSETLEYDYLIVATGLELRYDLIEGMDTGAIGDNGVTSIYYSPQAGIASHKQALAFAQSGGGKAVFTRPHGAMKCAGAPMKATNLVEYFTQQSGQRDNFQFDYFTAETFLFSVKAFNNRLDGIWQEREITPHYSHTIKAIDTDKREVFFAKADGSTHKEDYDFIHVVPPMSAVPVVHNSELADQGTYKGYVEVDKHTMQHTRYPNVFGLGDTVGTPIGKTAASVKSQLPVVAENITALIAGKTPQAKWNGYTSCPMILDTSHAMLWEFDYGMKPMTALPLQVVDPLEKSKVAWVMEKSLIRPVYDVMLEGFTPV
ncbi:NAD(P)/FAD-dependent oxidoreductase [Pontibacterium sp.]|uniref:NAD(P)/FAD-dependent oxidoreductase n=1 Tax=Pontibacterium sp. TaxID=2036026 RepID=UPI0035155628